MQDDVQHVLRKSGTETSIQRRHDSGQGAGDLRVGFQLLEGTCFQQVLSDGRQHHGVTLCELRPRRFEVDRRYVRVQVFHRGSLLNNTL